MKTLIQKSKSFVIDMGLGLLIANIALVVFVVIALGIFYIFDNQNVAYMLSAVIVAPFIILAYLRMYAGRYNILDNKDERTNGGHNSNGVVSSVSDRMGKLTKFENPPEDNLMRALLNEKMSEILREIENIKLTIEKQPRPKPKITYIELNILKNENKEQEALHTIRSHSWPSLLKHLSTSSLKDSDSRLATADVNIDDVINAYRILLKLSSLNPEVVGEEVLEELEKELSNSKEHEK